MNLIEEEGITFTAGATPFLQDMMQLEGLENRNISSLRVFAAMGAPIPMALVKEASEKVNFAILSGWGSNGMWSRYFDKA